MAEAEGGGEEAEAVDRADRLGPPARRLAVPRRRPLRRPLQLGRAARQRRRARALRPALLPHRRRACSSRTPRIVLVIYNDETLQQLGKRSPLDRRMLARALRALDAMHPRAIGIDILIDQAQPEDEELIATFRSLRTPTCLAFATKRPIRTRSSYWQEQFLRDFMRAVGAGTGPAGQHQDGARPRGRRDPALAASATPGLPPLLANALTADHPEFRNYTRGIDFRLPGDRRERRGSRSSPNLPDPDSSPSWARRCAPSDRGPLRPDRRRHPRPRRLSRRR